MDHESNKTPRKDLAGAGRTSSLMLMSIVAFYERCLAWATSAALTGGAAYWVRIAQRTVFNELRRLAASVVRRSLISNDPSRNHSNDARRHRSG
jgi:hypothetical protein